MDGVMLDDAVHFSVFLASRLFFIGYLIPL